MGSQSWKRRTPSSSPSSGRDTPPGGEMSRDPASSQRILGDVVSTRESCSPPTFCKMAAMSEAQGGLRASVIGSEILFTFYCLQLAGPLFNCHLMCHGFTHSSVSSCPSPNYPYTIEREKGCVSSLPDTPPTQAGAASRGSATALEVSENDNVHNGAL